MTTMTPRWCLRAVCIAVCIGAYWSASGLLQLHEVFSRAGARSPTIAHHRTTAAASTTKQFDRLVVVLIDALRADMVLGSDAMYGRQTTQHEREKPMDLSQHMQFTRELLAGDQAAAFVAHASTPTVTMPRLKALLSGKPPAFIDILKNFNSAALADENVVQLMREHDFRIVFYGDDTWLKLFPDTFQRHEGTSGFYTRDTVEVDTNVTRHLREELDPLMQHPKSKDWDVLVLHYLGLDHVGHLRGPRSHMMKDKLHEMDDVVRLVYDSVRAQDELRQQAPQVEEVKPTLVVLCSDHGMSEIGNHGGATVEESSALMAFMRGDKKPLGATESQNSVAPRRLQVDLVPTIATAFGLPIPTYSTGRLLEEVIAGPSDRASFERITALYANLMQLYTLAEIKFQDRELRVGFESLVNDAQIRISQGRTVHPDDEQLVSRLRAACDKLQQKVARSDGSEYDMMRIAAGVGLLLCCAMFSSRQVASSANILKPHWDLATIVAAIASVMTIVSLSSTSSIENEHATVFFVVTSLLLAALVDTVKRLRGLSFSSLLPVFYLVASLLCVRLLRDRNQVINFARLNGIPVDTSLPGNEFAADDSLSVWFTGPLFASLGAQAQLFQVLICCSTLWAATSRHKHSEGYSHMKLVIAVAVFTAGICANIWCSHLLDMEDTAGDATVKASVDMAAQTVYAAALLLVFFGFVSGDRWFITYTEMALWLLIILVQKSNNMASLAVLSLLRFFLSSLLRLTPRLASSVAAWALMTVWLATMGFFATGNSHLVTTIDISQSYHGLPEYSQGVVGVVTFISVFSGPLLAFMSCIDWMYDAKGASTVASASGAWLILAYQALRMAIYTIIVFFMRFHLFIWSVFAPKMLYEVAFTTAVAVFALLLS